MASATNNRGAVATVRIAPVERWCAPNKPNDIQLTRATKCSLLVGQEIGINVATMKIDEECGGKAWYMTAQSARRLDVLLDRQHDFNWSNTPALICEHMLEMD